MKNELDEAAKQFTSTTHGSSDFDKDGYFVKGQTDEEFVPLTYLKKKNIVESISVLQSSGYVVSSCDFLELDSFEKWYHKQFNKKLLAKDKKNVKIIHHPDTKKVFEAIEIVNGVYKILKDHKVLINGKNLPIQLGEWYAKSIFGLHQVKSSSQRGFDFFDDEGKAIEVKIHWQDATSPKGVKLKKSLLELSDYTVIMYIAKNFTIRDILFLDSDFILRKFANKGHTIFIKDQDVSGYFFSKSNKHYSKIRNKTNLMQFCSSNLAMKLDDKMSSQEG